MVNALQSTVWIIHDDPRSIFHDFDAKGGLHLTLPNVTLLYVIVYKDKQDVPSLSSNMVTFSYVNGFPTSRSFNVRYSMVHPQSDNIHKDSLLSGLHI